MRKITPCLKDIFSSLVERKYFCLGLLVVAVPVFLGLHYGADEAMIRITGMVLQLFGIGTVALGIHKTRREFGHPSIFRVWHQRLKRFLPFGKREVTGTAHITLPGVTCNARGHASVSVEPGATIEARVQALEENLQIVHNRINQAQNEMDQEFRKCSEALKHEERARDREDQKILSKLEATATGGLHISAMGALWLFVGVIMSTIPAELAKWLK
jgi:hypothetical protein